MLKRETDTEKNKNLEELNSKYNLEELFNNIVLKEEEKNSKKLKKLFKRINIICYNYFERF